MLFPGRSRLVIQKKRRVIAAMVLFLAACWCVGNWLSAPAGAAAAQSAPVLPGQLSHWELCDAWHTEKSAELTSELRKRRVLTDTDLVYAEQGRIYIGMSSLGVNCALGLPVHSKSFVSAFGTTTLETYGPQNDHEAITVRIEDGRVTSYVD
jgi:hypothetical protein